MELYQTTFNSILNYNKLNNSNSIADISNIIIQSLKDIIKFDYSWATDLSIEIIKNKKELNKDQFHYFLSNQYIKYFTKILDNSIYNYINNYKNSYTDNKNLNKKISDLKQEISPLKKKIYLL